MREEIAADAAAGHHEAVHVFCDQRAQRNVVWLRVDPFSADGFLVVFLPGGGVHVHAKGDSRATVFVSGSLNQIVLGHLIKTVNAPSVSDADLLGGRDQLNSFPGSAQRSQLPDDVVDLGSRSHRRVGNLCRVERTNTVLVVDHERQQIAAKMEQGRLAVRRVDAGAFDFLQEPSASLVLPRGPRVVAAVK